MSSREVPEKRASLVKLSTGSLLSQSHVGGVEKLVAPITVARAVTLETPTSQPLNPFDTDIEAVDTSRSVGSGRSTAPMRMNTDCQVWPSQDHWRRKAKAAKMSRLNCTCLGHLSNRNRIIVKVLIGVLVVGAAVATGVGISRQLGVGIWHNGTNRNA